MKHLFFAFYLMIFILAVRCHHIGNVNEVRQRPLKHIRNSEDLENAENDSVRPIYDKDFLSNIVQKLRLYIKKVIAINFFI